MAQSENQRLKLLYLLKILYEQTDEANGLSLKEIASSLNGYGITADRKTLYSDFEQLRRLGVDIISQQKGRDLLYCVCSRQFELPELKLLVDSVQSAKFLTERKSNELIKKLETLCSKHQAKHLQRQVWISGRVKTMNESIYYNVDALHEAINANKQIRFRYFQWNIRKEMQLRRNGAWYQVSPWGLMRDDENYYLVAYDAQNEKIKHYRIDKMQKLEVTEEDRIGGKQFEEFNLPKYTASLFGMFGGEPTAVTIEGRNELVGVIIDRFGKETIIRKKDEEHFVAQVNVAVSRQFLGWIVAIGDGLRITGPDTVVSMMRKEAERLKETYK